MSSMMLLIHSLEKLSRNLSRSLHGAMAPVFVEAAHGRIFRLETSEGLGEETSGVPESEDMISVMFE